MAKIATCPKCVKQLSLPAEIGPLDRAECPECQASFLVSEAAQTTLPELRLAPADQTESAAPTVADALDASVDPETTVEDLSPQQTWEERLKKALALDCSSEPATSEDESDKLEPAGLAQPSSPSLPDFEFKLDPPTISPPADLESAAEAAAKMLNVELPEVPTKRATTVTDVKQKTPVKTLADFASAAVVAADLPTEVTNPIDAKSPSQQPQAKPLAASYSPPPQARKPKSALGTAASALSTTASATLTKIADSVEASVVATNDNVVVTKSKRPGYSKLAAFAVGPIAGSLLGLYGLLWAQGQAGDYAGLGRVLPASLLPSSYADTSGDTNTADVDASISDLLAQKLDASPSTLKRDSSVSLATATQPLSKPGISDETFWQLADEAATALPDLVSTAMVTPEATHRKGQAYMKLCRLAEHADFARHATLPPSVRVKADAAVHTLRDAITAVGQQQDLAHIAGRWWEYGARRPNEGILFRGQVVDVQIVERGTVCSVRLESKHGATSHIPVWVAGKNYRVGETIGVVGRIVPALDGMPQDLAADQVVQLVVGFTL